jgi:hypothetical protein
MSRLRTHALNAHSESISQLRAPTTVRRVQQACTRIVLE